MPLEDREANLKKIQEKCGAKDRPKGPKGFMMAAPPRNPRWNGELIS